MSIRTIRELDELPDGTEIVIEDKRDTPLFKRGGDWYSPSKAATQNMIAYVNTRRWGVRVIERGTQK
ncbi:hypothetical protein ELB20_61 [Streptomyces phage phiELB20]|uniref:Uncharacterized protein n=1 Tax=Streptomyces phage phiELB20 TaxID=1211278 RepID=I7B7Q1_9CAUD|nr:hypothetical protein FDG59_gp23 [Streptomyces phage phiELB20]AFO10927.1 hypothetical protein ELB20_61 [Streptomyces phage phiELB20]